MVTVQTPCFSRLILHLVAFPTAISRNWWN